MDKKINDFFSSIDDIKVDNERVDEPGIVDDFDVEQTLAELAAEGITEDEIGKMFDENLETNTGDNIRKQKQVSIDNELVLEFVEKPTHENFNKLWARFYFGVKGHAYKFMHDWDLAADMACQTFTRAWEFREKYDYTKAKFSTWLYTICRNLCLGELNRKKKKDNYIPQDISDVYDSAMLKSSIASSTDSTQYIVEKGDVVGNSNEEIVTRMYDASINAIENMGGAYSKILKMKLVYDMKIREIADELGMNESTVKNYLYKGKEAVAADLKVNHPMLYEMYLESCADEMAKVI